MLKDGVFPVGKLPMEVLQTLLEHCRKADPRLIAGPAVGEDVAVIDMGDRYMVVKTDPITFASDQIGWYAVHVNANDIATSGAQMALLSICGQSVWPIHPERVNTTPPKTEPAREAPSVRARRYANQAAAMWIITK